MFYYDEDAERAAKILDEYDFTENLRSCYDAYKRDPYDIRTNIAVNYKELEIVLEDLSNDEFMQYLYERYNVWFEEQVKYTMRYRL